MSENLNPVIKSIKLQQTYCMIKPDGVKRGLVGEIISRIERAGLKIVALEMIKADEETIKKHYPMQDPAWIERLGDKGLSTFESLGLDAKEFLGTTDKKEIGEGVAEALTNFMTSGPVVCMVVEGVQAVDMMRKMCGNTLPFKAEIGTIRGDFSVDSPAVANVENRAIHNLIHASETLEEAENEINLWFGKGAINYCRAGEKIMYGKTY